jgi:hypothetical protein
MLKGIVFTCLMLTAPSLQATSFEELARCIEPTAPEKTLIVEFDATMEHARVIHPERGIQPARIISNRAIYIVLEFDDAPETLRIVISIDGQHQLLVLDRVTGTFQKKADLDCKMAFDWM